MTSSISYLPPLSLPVMILEQSLIVRHSVLAIYEAREGVQLALNDRAIKKDNQSQQKLEVDN
jgi:hypothetical protein